MLGKHFTNERLMLIHFERKKQVIDLPKLHAMAKQGQMLTIHGAAELTDSWFHRAIVVDRIVRLLIGCRRHSRSLMRIDYQMCFEWLTMSSNEEIGRYEIEPKTMDVLPFPWAFSVTQNEIINRIRQCCFIIWCTIKKQTRTHRRFKQKTVKQKCISVSFDWIT